MIDCLFVPLNAYDLIFKDKKTMLSSINVTDTPQLCREPKYDRNEKEDLKLALDYLWEFKEKLMKLHPNVLYTVEKWLQNKF